MVPGLVKGSCVWAKSERCDGEIKVLAAPGRKLLTRARREDHGESLPRVSEDEEEPEKEHCGPRSRTCQVQGLQGWVLRRSPEGTGRWEGMIQCVLWEDYWGSVEDGLEHDQHGGGVATRKLPQRSRWEVVDTRPRPRAAGWEEEHRDLRGRSHGTQ